MDVASADQLLTTTRAVRKRLDLARPVPRAVIDECIEIALQAPTGSNSQGWHFVVLTDPEKRAAIARLYQKAFTLYANRTDQPGYEAGDPRIAQMPRVRASATYLADHLHEVPVLVIPCVEGRVEKAGVLGQASIYGSILPAAWSFLLALRARGLGSAWTTLHLMYEEEAAKILGVPSHVTQAALFPVAYYTGKDFKPAPRVPAERVTHWNQWNGKS